MRLLALVQQVMLLFISIEKIKVIENISSVKWLNISIL